MSAVAAVRSIAGTMTLHVETTTEQHQLRVTKKLEALVHTAQREEPVAAERGHDDARVVDPEAERCAGLELSEHGDLPAFDDLARDAFGPVPVAAAGAEGQGQSRQGSGGQSRLIATPTTAPSAVSPRIARASATVKLPRPSVRYWPSAAYCW